MIPIRIKVEALRNCIGEMPNFSSFITEMDTSVMTRWYKSSESFSVLERALLIGR